MHFFTSDPCLQVESVFETLVEDSPEEESTLTSKMSVHTRVCVCVSVRGCTCVHFGEVGGPCPGVGGGVSAVVPFKSLAFLLSRTWQHHLQPVWRWRRTRY